MSFTLVPAQGTATVLLTANQKIAVKSQGEAQVLQVLGFPNYPPQNDLLRTVNNETWVSSAFSGGASLVIQAGGFPVLFATGTDPVISDNGLWQPQVAPVARNAAIQLTANDVLAVGLITNTHATGATVALDLPNGADLDAASNIKINESFEWSVINLSSGAGDTVTVQVGVATTHTIIGSGIVAISSSATFRTRKTAANTFVSYRV